MDALCQAVPAGVPEERPDGGSVAITGHLDLDNDAPLDKTLVAVNADGELWIAVGGLVVFRWLGLGSGLELGEIDGVNA